jgi:hypothetical protein
VLVGSDGVGDRGVKCEGVREPGDQEDLQDPAAAGHEIERSLAHAQPFEAAHQGTETCRVEEIYAAQVRDDMTGAVVDEADDALAQLRGGVHIDLARDLQDGAVARADGFHMKDCTAGLPYCSGRE